MALTDLWREMDAAKARAQAEIDVTKSAIENLSCLGGKWRFVGVREGPKWIARHRYDGEVSERSSTALVERIKEIIARHAPKVRP